MLFAQPAVQTHGLSAATGARFPQLAVGHRTFARVVDHTQLTACDQFGNLTRQIVTACAADTES